MKRDVLLWQAAGFAATAGGGTLLHFLYEWSGKSPWVALFSAVNESIWEHMKLLYVSLLVFALVQSFFFRDFPRFWRVKLAGTVAGLLLIPALFYLYNGAIGTSPDWLNISFFFLSAAAVFLLEWHLFGQGGRSSGTSRLSQAILLGIGVLFGVFTYVTPHLPLFRDPLTGTYGI